MIYYGYRHEKGDNKLFKKGEKRREKHGMVFVLPESQLLIYIGFTTAIELKLMDLVP